MTQDMSIEQIAEWHARTADVERDPEIRAFHLRAARVLQMPCERVHDPIAHGPFFDGLQDMPYGGSRQTTHPVETPDDATKAIQELQTLSGEYCTCLSISRDPHCVHHGDVDKVASVNHGPTLREAQKTVADHYGAGWVSMAELYQREQERVAFYERHTDTQANELVALRVAVRELLDAISQADVLGWGDSALEPVRAAMAKLS